jgi:hypothetical protein
MSRIGVPRPNKARSSERYGSGQIAIGRVAASGGRQSRCKLVHLLNGAVSMYGTLARSGHTVMRRALHESVLLVLLVTSVVHVVRRNVLDVALFLGAAALIVLERAHPPQRPARRLPPPPRAAVLAACAAFGIAMWPLARGGWPMRLLLAVPGVLALVVVLRFAPVTPTSAESEHAGPPGRRWWLWVMVGVAAGLFELANFASQGGSPDANPDHPTVSAVVEPFFADASFRAVFAAAWLAAGAWLVLVATRPPEVRR